MATTFRPSARRWPASSRAGLAGGLDGRILRITPPPTVDWYDVDFPAVIAARRVLVPHHAHVHVHVHVPEEPTGRRRRVWSPSSRRTSSSPDATASARTLGCGELAFNACTACG